MCNRQVVHPDAERVENGVGDGGSCRAMCGLTGAERIQISALDQFDIDFRHLAEAQDRLLGPACGADALAVETHALLQHPGDPRQWWCLPRRIMHGFDAVFAGIFPRKSFGG